MNTWELLTKELAINGIKIVDAKNCTFLYNGKEYTTPITKKIKLLQKFIFDNNVIFDNLWKEVADILYTSANSNLVAHDILLTNIFVDCVKELHLLARMICQSQKSFYKFAKNHVFQKLQIALNTDFIKYSKETQSVVIDYKLSIDWVARKNSHLSYLISLLKFAMTGTENVSQHVVKTARGISGPWANLDLPMLERTFPWSDIEEEVRGREKDKENQARYNQWQQDYHKQGVGEGYYWREMRNEPFSWYNQEDNPYPHRNLLWG